MCVRVVAVVAVCVQLVACTGPGATDPGGDGTSDADTDASPPTDTDTDADTDDPTSVPDPCDPSPTLQVLAFAAAAGPIESDAELTVELSEAATVAVLCTADDDATEQHLVESSAAGTAHALRLQGLLRSTTYTCEAAPTCPTMAAPPAVLPLVTHAGPSELPDLDVTIDPALGMTGWYTLMPFTEGGGCQRWKPIRLVIFDGEGHPRWWYTLPDGVSFDVEALWHPDDRVLLWGGGGSPEGELRTVDLWDGDTFEITAGPATVFHHDAKRIEDGRYLTLETRLNGIGLETWAGFGVRLWDPTTGAVDFDLGSQRYVDEGWLPPGSALDLDPYHLNWMDWHTDASGADVLYTSLCYDQALMSFDVATGDVRWKLQEGAGWTALDATGAPATDAMPQCAHGLEVLDDDVLLVYDNGQQRSFSQITELRIDPAAQTYTVEWRWSEPGWHESTLGDVDDLGDGRVLVTQAHPECWSDTPNDRSSIVEIDRATGAVASRLDFPSPLHSTYRSERYDGCELFSSTEACPALAIRAAELAPLVGW